MIASCHALSLWCNQRGVSLVQKGNRVVNTNDIEYNGGRMRYSFSNMRNTMHGLDGFVPWTNPIRNAVDYINHCLLHIYIRNNYNLATANIEIGVLRNYLGVEDIGQYCGMMAYRGQVVKNMNTAITDTCLYQYLAGIARREQHFAPSRRKQFRVSLRNVRRGAPIDAGNGILTPAWVGTVHMEKYGWELKSFHLTNDGELVQELNENMGAPLLFLMAKVSIENVEVEQHFITFRIRSIIK